MYEPSKELIEQIAKEFQNRKPLDYPLTDAEAYIKTDICVQLPTIRKALEMYEMIPDEGKNKCNDCPYVDSSPDDHVYPYNWHYCSILPHASRISVGGFIKFPDCPRPYKGKEQG